MARPRKPIEAGRRDRLMRQARAHFVRCGYTGASLSEILSAAEFPRSSFYYFFGGKAALFEAAFSDGLARLAERVRVPDVDSLDAESFWPSILGFLDDLEEAGADQDISTIPRLFHMPDAPECAARVDFGRAARQWCERAVRTGRALGVLDREIPVSLHVELVWSIAIVLDRWMASQAAGAVDGRGLSRILMTRVLGAPSS